MTSDDLARQLLAQAAAIAELRAVVDQLTDDTTDNSANLVTRVEDLERAAAPRPVALTWCWRNATPRASEALWHELITWTDWIRHRYPLARRIPECWHQHPEAVEELTALWLAWHGAFEDAEASLTAAADWHDRWLPGVLHRLEHGPFSLDCGNGHHDRPAGAYASLPDQDEVASS
jgi:hypothetical protein